MVNDMKLKYIPERGDIVWINFNPTRGHEQKGKRPAIVLSPKLYNSKSNFIIVTPSRWLADLVQKSILKDKRIEIIPNGIDEKYIKLLEIN